MPVELGLWRVDGRPVRLAAVAMPLEARLEELIESDPGILGEAVLLIGRQVPTDHGKLIDLLGVDNDGVIHVLELKRDRTPREVVAQVLDYGSWVQDLTNDDVREFYATYRPRTEFDAAFAEMFGAAPPEDLNTAHTLTVIASEVDAATERIVTYLNTGFGVPVNVVFFRYFVDEGREYLGRTWLLDETRAAAPSSGAKGKTTKEPWNGQDWYVSFGEDSKVRSWDDARRYGFISAGGGEWFSRTLRALPVGGRVFVLIPKTGYVGVGTVAGEARPFSEAVLAVDGDPRKMSELPLVGSYVHSGAGADDEDRAEYIVPVAWQRTLPREQAIWQQGMFANQNSACKLRNRFTLEELAKAFDPSE